MNEPDFDFESTRYGFRWGPMTVERLGSGPFGVVLRVYAKDRSKYVDVRVSAKGQKIELIAENQLLAETSLLAERDTYREALERVVEASSSEMARPWLEMVANIARTALQGGEG